LNSGSSGNSTVIKAGKTTILLDSGLSGKETARRLNHIDISPESISGILVSHGHSDHVRGVGVLARRYDIPVYLNRKTALEIDTTIGNVPELNIIKTGSSFELGELTIDTFSISHDSADPMGFVFKGNNSQLAHITDLGKVTEAILKKVQDMDAMVIESNHDLDMLINGSYPEYLKKRILGPRGHLSNIAAANTLVDAVGSNTKIAVLAHISEDNNDPKLVYSTVAEILDEEGLSDLELCVASRYGAIDPITI
jgi:phosphoribosyl 1,2-cyclic phosphodiesterase